ncbi:MAG: hypothetical protein ACQKBY_01985, partial [Verrucomicrobiales bacterium]
MNLLLLLAVVIISFLSLGMVTVRSASLAEKEAVAKANARLALTLALGKLQQVAGPDTRVTARADLLDENHPYLTGVWRSWEGTDHDGSGRPVSPGDYESQKEDRFLSWLVSSERTDQVGDVPDTVAGPGKVTLLGEGSVADEEGEIHLQGRPVSASGEQGELAWWIGGENQKARLPRPRAPEEDDAAAWAQRRQSHATADPETFGLSAVLADPALAEKAESLRTADFLGSAGAEVARESYHELSATSVGLLTNVATGGWRKDLSLLTEKWDELDQVGLELFQVEPGNHSSSTRPSAANFRASRSILYPWGEYRAGSGDVGIYQHGPVASWANLVDFATTYRRVSGSSASGLSLAPHSVHLEGSRYDFLHKVRVIPVIARVQWVYSHYAGPAPTPSGQSGSFYEARLLLTPVVTLWNPYNVELNFTQTPLRFRSPKPLPSALLYQVG